MKSIRSQEHIRAHLGGYALLVAVVLTTTFLAGYWTHFIQSLDQANRFTLLSQAYGIVQKNFSGHLPDDTQFEYGMIRGMLAELEDPYTTFTEPRAAELDADRLAGRFGGIGARITKTEQGTFILTPIENHPAIRAGIMPDDQLIAIDRVRVSENSTIDEVVGRIRGEIGTLVILTIRTNKAAPRDVGITRAQIDIPSVSWRQWRHDATIGVLDIEHFSNRTADEAEDGIRAMLEAGVTRMILDLRGNGGGLLQSSVDVADLFLGSGVIVYQASRGELEESIRARTNAVALHIPLVVLVDSSSASAAEILAAALQEHGRAPLIGNKTFGKGSVQLIFGLADDSSLHVTNARWFTPEHRPLDSNGLDPDIVVDTNLHKSETDAVLSRAAAYLNEQQRQMSRRPSKTR